MVPSSRGHCPSKPEPQKLKWIFWVITPLLSDSSMTHPSFRCSSDKSKCFSSNSYKHFLLNPVTAPTSILIIASTLISYSDSYYSFDIYQLRMNYNTAPSDSDSSDAPSIEIIKQGKGIRKQIKNEIIQLYHESRVQPEFQNPAEYIKHRLDGMFKPFWFVFIWNNDFNHDIKFAYNDVDNRFLEFKYHNNTVLVYQFIARDPEKEHRKYLKPSYPTRFYYPPDFYFDEYYDPYLHPPYPFPNPTISHKPVYQKTQFF